MIPSSRTGATAKNHVNLRRDVKGCGDGDVARVARFQEGLPPWKKKGDLKHRLDLHAG